MKKTCTKCGVEKTEGEFHWKKKGVCRHTKCKECANALARKWSRENGSRRQGTRRWRTMRNRRTLYEWLFNQECVECGESDPVVLELHHRDPSEKSAAISTMASSGTSIDVMFAEIKKCDVVCANCHRKRHFEIRDGFRRTRVT